MKNKNQLDATYYIIVLLIGSTCFGHYYAHRQELATIKLITTLVVSFCKDGGVNVSVILRNTDNTSNYKPTNETHHTQQNTTINTHSRTLRSPHTTEHYDHNT